MGGAIVRNQSDSRARRMIRNVIGSILGAHEVMRRSRNTTKQFRSEYSTSLVCETGIFTVLTILFRQGSDHIPLTTARFPRCEG